MIRYSLQCGLGHGFDGWFRDSDAFEKQSRDGDILCPHCGDSKVEKALMTPGVISGKKSSRGSSGGKEEAAMASSSSGMSAMQERHRQEMMLALAREHVERNFEYLGEAFVEEARRIHRGDADARDIYGEASAEEVRDLGEEGIEVFALPKKPRHMDN